VALSPKHHEFAEEKKGARVYDACKDLTEIRVKERKGQLEGRQVCEIGEYKGEQKEGQFIGNFVLSFEHVMFV
jgi:hypothetical protein